MNNSNFEVALLKAARPYVRKRAMLAAKRILLERGNVSGEVNLEKSASLLLEKLAEDDGAPKGEGIDWSLPLHGALYGGGLGGLAGGIYGALKKKEPWEKSRLRNVLRNAGLVGGLGALGGGGIGSAFALLEGMAPDDPKKKDSNSGISDWWDRNIKQPFSKVVLDPFGAYDASLDAARPGQTGFQSFLEDIKRVGTRPGTSAAGSPWPRRLHSISPSLGIDMGSTGDYDEALQALNTGGPGGGRQNPEGLKPTSAEIANFNPNARRPR